MVSITNLDAFTDSFRYYHRLCLLIKTDLDSLFKSLSCQDDLVQVLLLLDHRSIDPFPHFLAFVLDVCFFLCLLCNSFIGDRCLHILPIALLEVFQLV